MGHTRVILQTDSGPTIKSLVRRVCDMKSQQTGMEYAFGHQPQANVLAERCVQTVTELFGTTTGALDHRMGDKMPDNHPVLTWIVKHDAPLHNRNHVAVDGERHTEHQTYIARGSE